MKVKIFHSEISTDDLENKIAEWNDPLSPKIHKVEVSVFHLKDYFPDDTIRNQWREYMTVILYEKC